MKINLSDKQMDEFFEDDRFDIPEEYFNMSPEELEKKAEEILKESKDNPRFPRTNKPIPKCLL